MKIQGIQSNNMNSEMIQNFQKKKKKKKKK